MNTLSEEARAFLARQIGAPTQGYPNISQGIARTLAAFPSTPAPLVAQQCCANHPALKANIALFPGRVVVMSAGRAMIYTLVHPTTFGGLS